MASSVPTHPIAQDVEAPAPLGMAGALLSAGAAIWLVYMALYVPPRAWLIEYYPNTSLEGPPNPGLLRDPGFDTSKALLPAGFPEREDFSLRFRSCLRVSVEERFAFQLKADDQARLYVDGELVADTQAKPKGKPKRKRKLRDDSLVLAQGEHAITIEYFNARGVGALSVKIAEGGAKEFRSLRGRTHRPGERGECDSI
jgi:hypothetical protein